MKKTYSMYNQITILVISGAGARSISPGFLTIIIDCTFAVFEILNLRMKKGVRKGEL